MTQNKGINVLSLFDGVSCGRVALERANIKVNKYYASEIDKYAIKVSENNYPNIEQLGSVLDIDYTKYEGEVDLVIGGSPCQDLSAYKYDRGDVKGLKGKKSNLFYQFERAIKEIKPKYFLLENVVMQKEWQDIITNILGVEPILINSSLVCGAERKRLYWTNIPNINQPSNKNILLENIVEDSVDRKYYYTGKYKYTYNGDDKKVQCTLHLNGHRNAKEVYNLKGKCNTLLCDGNGGNLVKKIYQNGEVRKLTPLEYERLQTLSDHYTDGISDSRRYTAIGNGWTVDVIAHIFKSLKVELDKIKEELN